MKGLEGMRGKLCCESYVELSALLKASSLRNRQLEYVQFIPKSS
jgi:hypothetical protein